MTIFRMTLRFHWDLPASAQYVPSQQSFCYFFNRWGVVSQGNSAPWRIATCCMMAWFFLPVRVGFEKGEVLNLAHSLHFLVTTTDMDHLWTVQTLGRHFHTRDLIQSTVNGKTSGWLPFSLDQEHFVGLEHTHSLLLPFLHIVTHTYWLCKSFPINSPKLRPKCFSTNFPSS